MADGLHQITPPSAVVLDERKYPVIFEEPTWSQICEWLFVFFIILFVRRGMVVGVVLLAVRGERKYPVTFEQPTSLIAGLRVPCRSQSQLLR